MSWWDRLPIDIQNYILKLAHLESDCYEIKQIKGDFNQYNTKGSYLGKHYSTYFHTLTFPIDKEKNYLELEWKVIEPDDLPVWKWQDLELHKIVVLAGNGRTVKHRKIKVEDPDKEYKISVRFSKELMLSNGKAMVKYWFHSPLCICNNGLFKDALHDEYLLTEKWSYPKHLEQFTVS